MGRLAREILANTPGLLFLTFFSFFPVMISDAYILRVAVFVGIYVILTLSLNLLNGYIGLLSIGHAAFYGIGAYASAMLSMSGQVPFPAAMLAAGGIAGAFGWMVAMPTLRLSGIYLTLATLGFNLIIWLALLNWVGFTNGPLGIMNIPSPVIFGRIIDSPAEYYYLIFGLALLTLASMNRLVNSRFGRALIAIREDEQAAKTVGVQTIRYKIQAFVLAAFYAGIAGSFYAHFIHYISPDSFYIYESFILLAMLALGGQGNLLGPVVGAAVLMVIPELFRFLKEYRMFIYGGVLIGMMLVRREGIFGKDRYSLRLKWFDAEKGPVYERGDKFLPEDP